MTLVNPIRKIVSSGENAVADAARLFKVHQDVQTLALNNLLSDVVEANDHGTEWINKWLLARARL